ncbi:MAG: lipase family protein [Hymenobacteraceae bacterium]|nr:lipase family protein [Hymenobacteraceae bacterium]MDX5397800.1 lipase family protein [Hymenobacteraceae bacterium]MDX5442707.1 lipase family protein [Hymenobacteraceae bacterium]MDX5513879.1 lipase family protein [Hymenobacteraceae bacterium]
MKKNNIFSNILMAWALMLSVLATGCSKSPDVAPAETPVAVQPRVLISADKLATFPAVALQLAAQSQGFGNFANEFKYDVSLYRVVYHTTYQNQKIAASGLVCLPDSVAAPVPMLSAQHGTIFKDDEAPSAFTDGFTGFEFFASAGYATVIPDYIGFGSSKDIFHPYYDQKHSGLAVVDMIKAGKELSDSLQVPLSEKLFLAGYSEGGYVTLAAQKEVETNPEHNLNLTAVGAGAGGYDLTEMLAMVKSGDRYGNPSYLAYVLMSYNHTYNWNRPLTDFFQEPYASRLPGLFNGQYSGSQINSQLSTDPEQLFNPQFMQALRGNGEQALKQAVANNSFLNWAPKAPTKLYHGTSDTVVPFANSQTTYDRFRAAGATNVRFIPIPGGTHGSSLAPMLLDLIPWMKTF